MAYEHSPLTESALGPAVWKVVAPGAPAPLQTMVARGLAPLGPRDLVVALYQLWVNNTPPLAEQAAKTIAGLPDSILGAALDDPNLPPGALDFVGRKLPRNPMALEAVVRHPRVDDQTLVALARVCPEGVCDLLAENQTRWLACPAIVESLYQNPNCRMSVAQRMLELAVREGVELKLPNIEEIKQAIFAEDEPEVDDEQGDHEFRRAAQRVIKGQAEIADRLAEAGVADEVDLESVREEPDALAGLDAILDQMASDELSLPLDPDGGARAAATTPQNEPEEAENQGDPMRRISRLSPMKKIRLALIGNSFERAILIRDSNKAVCLSAIKSPKVKENDVQTYCAKRNLPHDVVRYIASRRDWTKNYSVRLNLVLNPKTPMASAMTLLNFLHAHDVKKVAHSRNIPSALATAAKRRMSKRR